MANNTLSIAIPAATALLGAVAGAGATYYGAYKQASNDAFKSAIAVATPEEKVENVRLAVSAGLLKIPEKELTAIFADNREKLPSGFNCGYTWCVFADKISSIKSLYQQLNFYGGPINGNADLEFGKATMKFQQSVGLAVDGIVGATTFERIRQKSEELGNSISM